MCSQGLADNTVIAKVNNDVWDLDRPLEGDCSLKLLKFDDPDGETIIIISRRGLVVD
jgi:threonyl-tRNA synthetase